LRELLEKRVIDEAESKTKANKERAVLEALTAELEVELPATMIQQELDFLVRQQASYLQERIDPAMAKQLFTKELVEEMRRLNRPEAVKRLRRKVALDEIVKQEKIVADEATLNERVAGALEALKGQNIDPDRLATVIREEILTENALAWLIEHSEIELVEQGSLKPPVDETLESIEPEVDADGVVTVDATSEEA